MRKTGLNVHKTWACHHLLSYAGTGDSFSLQQLQSPSFEGIFRVREVSTGLLSLWPLREVYVDSLPEALRSSALNPYLLVEVRK